MGLFRILVRLFSARRPRPPVEPWRGIPDYPPKPREMRVVVVQTTQTTTQPVEKVLRGPCWVLDGDTIIIDKVPIRIAGIDAPELDHPFGQQSKWALVKLCKGQVVTARLKPELSYDRLVAECFLPDGRDLGAEMVRAGLALDWPKFSGGKYRHLEQVDARKKLWRASARQRGMMGAIDRMPE
jgi:micrococcal nuclease